MQPVDHKRQNSNHAMLQLLGVSKTYANKPAIDAIDLTVQSGLTTVLVGPSGCGKSTLLRLMIGLIWPDQGVLNFEGTPLLPASIMALRRRMGYVIQDGGLFPHLTARDNVQLMARHLDWELNRIQARLMELAELTRFPTDGLQRYPAQLSGGQKQRVSLMRALMLDPDMLLLDEPLGALDPLIRADLQTDLRRIFRTLKKTVVLVTHDMSEAAYLGDLIVLLRDGRIVQQGTFEECERAPADPFVTRFINAQHRPPENPRNGLS